MWYFVQVVRWVISNIMYLKFKIVVSSVDSGTFHHWLTCHMYKIYPIGSNALWEVYDARSYLDTYPPPLPLSCPDSPPCIFGLFWLLLLLRQTRCTGEVFCLTGWPRMCTTIPTSFRLLAIVTWTTRVTELEDFVWCRRCNCFALW